MCVRLSRPLKPNLNAQTAYESLGWERDDAFYVYNLSPPWSRTRSSCCSTCPSALRWDGLAAVAVRRPKRWRCLREQGEPRCEPCDRPHVGVSEHRRAGARQVAV